LGAIKYERCEYMSRDIERIQHYLDHTVGSKIWVVSGNLKQAKLYWDKISKELNWSGGKVYFMPSSPNTIDGLNPFNTLILLCGRWWTNRATKTEIFKQYLKDTRCTIPIGEL